MFQLTGDKGTELIEFYTIRDTPDAVEERIRFYSPDLEEGPGNGVTMKLASFLLGASQISNLVQIHDIHRNRNVRRIAIIQKMRQPNLHWN
jgi:hypothetical protein